MAAGLGLRRWHPASTLCASIHQVRSIDSSRRRPAARHARLRLPPKPTRAAGPAAPAIDIQQDSTTHSSGLAAGERPFVCWGSSGRRSAMKPGLLGRRISGAPAVVSLSASLPCCSRRRRRLHPLPRLPLHSRHLGHVVGRKPGQPLHTPPPAGGSLSVVACYSPFAT